MASQSNDRGLVIRPFLRNAKNVVVTCHHGPDGDALAAILSVTASLRLARWNAVAVSSSPIPPAYSFMAGADEVIVYRPEAPESEANPRVGEVLDSADAIICLDSSDIERLGRLYSENRARFDRLPIINIDHHGSNNFFGKVNVVEPGAASVCELLVQMMEREDLPITTEIANTLLVGIVADTIGFRTGATTATTLRTAASLMERGASLSHISESVFNTRSAPSLRLWGRVLSRSHVDGRLVWSDITREMLLECNATMADADSLVDFIAGVPGTSGAFLFSEQDGRVRVSMRTSQELNASQLATHFGGGGHPRAAGCTLDGTIEEAQRLVLGEARARLDRLVASGDGRQEIDS